jgi:hypothetical protein
LGHTLGSPEDDTVYRRIWHSEEHSGCSNGAHWHETLSVNHQTYVHDECYQSKMRKYGWWSVQNGMSQERDTLPRRAKLWTGNLAGADADIELVRWFVQFPTDRTGGSVLLFYRYYINHGGSDWAALPEFIASRKCTTRSDAQSQEWTCPNYDNGHSSLSISMQNGGIRETRYTLPANASPSYWAFWPAYKHCHGTSCHWDSQQDFRLVLHVP